MKIKVTAWIEVEPLRTDDSAGGVKVATCDAVAAYAAGADEAQAREALRVKVAERAARLLRAHIVDAEYVEDVRR